MKNKSGLFDRMEFAVEAAVEHLLLQIDLAEFYRQSVLQNLRQQRETPCPVWIQSFKEEYDPYPLEMIQSAYREACSELIEYFSED